MSAEMPLTAEELDQIRARAEAATPGPWYPEFNETTGDGVDIWSEGAGEYVARDIENASPSDTAFAAAARTDVPRLLAEVERLRAEVAGRVSVETAEAIWRAGVIAGGDAEEPTARPSRAEVLAEVATDLETAGHELAATELREWIEAEKTMSPDMRRGLVAMMRHQELAAGRIDTEDHEEPVALRWGLDDVELGDDGSVTLMLSGPHGEPYVLELDPARAVALGQPITEHAEPYAQGTVDTSDADTAVGELMAQTERRIHLIDQDDPDTEAAAWNELYPPGTTVVAYPGCRPEDDPNGKRLDTVTRSQAWVLGGHTPVVKVDGHSAAIALTHVDVRTAERGDDRG